MVWMPAEDLAAHELRLNYSDVNEADVWGLGVRLPFFFKKKKRNKTKLCGLIQLPMLHEREWLRQMSHVVDMNNIGT